MKRLQEETMCKMAVLGRGSMKDKQKVGNKGRLIFFYSLFSKKKLIYIFMMDLLISGRRTSCFHEFEICASC